MDEVYASLAYDSAPLLRVPLCVSRAFLVNETSHILRLPQNVRYSRQATTAQLVVKQQAHFKVKNMLFHKVVLVQCDHWSTESVEVCVV